LTSRSRLRPALAVVTLLAALASGSAPLASGQQSLIGAQQTAQQLRNAIAAEDAQLSTTRQGLSSAQQRLAALTSRAQALEAQLTGAQQRLTQARIRLSYLQRRQADAQRLLAADLVQQYKSGEPQLVTVVLSSTHFADLWQQLDFFRRVSRQNAQILDTTRTARAAVAAQTNDLQRQWKRYSALTEQALIDRGRANAIQTALLQREQTQLAHRDAAGARLAAVRGRIAQLQRAQAAAAALATSAATSTAQAPPVTASGPSDPSGVVARVIAAANQIATTPYVWGGGHGGASGGYDCSGSVSYALIAGGLLSSPLDSTGFESWGLPGPGQHITVYANAGHAFMIVDGRRFDTVALSGGGTRWTSAPVSTAGFVARHPPGL